MRESSQLVDRSQADQVVVLRGVSWEQYDTIDSVRGADVPQPRMAYLDGALEIMTTGRPHEIERKMIARLLEAYADAADIELMGAGNETLRDEAKEAGLEPDECYFLDVMKAVPDLAIEVVHTSGGIDKLEVYRRLGIREVWFFQAGAFQVFRLAGRSYRRTRKSAVVRGIDLEEIAEIVRRTGRGPQTRPVRLYRRAVERRRTRERERTR